MATKQDFLDLEGSRFELSEIIVGTAKGDVIVCRCLPGDEIELTEHGKLLAEQLDGEGGGGVKRRKRAALPEVVVPAGAPVPAP